jgi:hypothetical protein
MTNFEKALMKHNWNKVMLRGYRAEGKHGMRSFNNRRGCLKFKSQINREGNIKYRGLGL